MKKATVSGKCSSVASRLLIGLVLATAVAFAQRTQIGGTFGLGSAGDGEAAAGPYVMAGAEGCVLCRGRLGLFFEYNHWQLAGPRNNPVALDLGGGGLRIQGKGPRVRPFFDIGIAGGHAEGTRKFYSSNVGGMVLGGGATVFVGKRWYVRPEVKMAVLSIGAVTAMFSTGVGYRFQATSPMRPPSG